MRPANPDLLRPSLSEPESVAAAPHSQQTAMLTAFFGGPLAIATLLAIDAKRLGRLGRDLIWVGLVLAVYAGWLALAYKTPQGMALQLWLVDELGRRGPAYVERLLALLAFALGLFLHRREQRSASLFGLKRPNGWITGLGLIAMGYVVSDMLHAALP